MANYPQIYVYTAKTHPKRGKRYGWHFKIVRRYKDIRDVIWMDGSKGHVRDGEYMTMNYYNQTLGKQDREKDLLERQKKAVEAQALRDRLRDTKQRLKADRADRDLERHVKEEQIKEANSFRLEAADG